jgi:hypothetical protein
MYIPSFHYSIIPLFQPVMKNKKAVLTMFEARLEQPIYVISREGYFLVNL